MAISTVMTIRRARVDGLALAAGLCAVPVSIAVSETFLTIALVSRIVRLARHRVALNWPVVCWLWLGWAGLEHLQEFVRKGGLLITARLGLLAAAVTFWLTLAAGIGVLAASGHCMVARWAFAPVCGFDYWRVIITSPEILIFLFFMITDP